MLAVAKRGGHLVLGGGHLVVLGLGADAQLPKLLVQVRHERLHPGPDGAEIVVFQLLALGGGSAQQGAPGEEQVRPAGIVGLVDEKILLLRPHGGVHPLGRAAQKGQDAAGLAAQGIHAAQKRGLFVQHFAGIAAKGGGDAQGFILDESVAGGVPGGVAPGLEGGPQPAGGKTGGVGLAFYQLFARKFHQHAPARHRVKEAVVLFGGHAGHGLEPMGKMGGPLADRPVLHGGGHRVRHGRVQGRAFLNGLLQRVPGRLGQQVTHHAAAEHHASEQFWYLAHIPFTPFYNC